ncbi:MAG: beta-ketoacyl-[acyl-carrier-protein] synthase II, partial [Saprospiraceae bacterium]|nr:beta-ketoacyl-[acyl-carrier-protein] synthase II [Saprospiraceae bacterium]
MRRVVITGIGAVTPIGNNISDFNSALQSGVSGAGIITHFDPTNFKTKFACEIKNFDPGEAFDRKEGKRMDLFTQYAMVAAHEAMLQSGIDLEKIDLERAGVIWGSGIGGLKSLETEIVEYAKGNGMPRYNPFMIPKMISDIAAGQISIKYGMR